MKMPLKQYSPIIITLVILSSITALLIGAIPRSKFVIDNKNITETFDQPDTCFKKVTKNNETQMDDIHVIRISFKNGLVYGLDNFYTNDEKIMEGSFYGYIERGPHDETIYNTQYAYTAEGMSVVEERDYFVTQTSITPAFGPTKEISQNNFMYEDRTKLKPDNKDLLPKVNCEEIQNYI